MRGKTVREYVRRVRGLLKLETVHMIEEGADTVSGVES
jgi:hypothetical protein